MVVLNKRYTDLPFCENEILRYAGCKTADPDVSALITACIAEAEPMLSYQVCYAVLPVRTQNDCCDFGVFSVRSSQLAKRVSSCEKIVLFAATVGVGIDRLIAKYSRLSPSKAVLLQAIGAERIEALCDRFCEDLADEHLLAVQPRFSPGYGDLPLGVQKEIVALLDCTKRIGVSLNDSLLMSPSKSVTAFVGLGGAKRPCDSKCKTCDKHDCVFRGVL